jgi:phage antirepressor YoqD-like protein
MNNIVQFGSDGNTPLTMSSLEISELVGSRHDKVKQSIDRLVKKDTIQQPPLGEVKNDQGQKVQVYNLIKRDSYVVVAQLSPEFTARLVDRWQELEKKVQEIDPMEVLNNPAAMRGLLSNYVEKVLELEGQVETLKPAQKVLSRISYADGSECITDVAKTLQIRPKELFSFMRINKWIYSRPGTSNIGYQTKIMQGLLEHKVTSVRREDGSEKVTTQVRVTPKGMAKLAEELDLVEGA